MKENQRTADRSVLGIEGIELPTGLCLVRSTALRIIAGHATRAGAEAALQSLVSRMRGAGAERLSDAEIGLLRKSYLNTEPLFAMVGESSKRSR